MKAAPTTYQELWLPEACYRCRFCQKSYILGVDFPQHECTYYVSEGYEAYPINGGMHRRADWCPLVGRDAAIRELMEEVLEK